MKKFRPQMTHCSPEGHSLALLPPGGWNMVDGGWRLWDPRKRRELCRDQWVSFIIIILS